MAAWLVALVLCAPALEADVANALAKSGIKRSGLSVVVGRAGAAPSYSLAPAAPRIPASNQKVLTAAAALRRLGRDFHFETRLALGPDGELVVTGDGDPNFSGRFFDGDEARVLRVMARDAKTHGVRRITDLVLDASRFDDAYVHPDWPANQLGRWYCAPVAALVFNDSCWDVTVLPGLRAGAPARVRVEPDLVRPAVANRCATAAQGHVVHIGRDGGSGIEVRGKIVLTSAGVTGQVTVRDPVGFFGNALAAALREEGIEITGRVRTGRVPGARDIVVIRGDLKRTLEVMLTRSQNLYAECAFKRLGQGSFASGAAAVVSELARMGAFTEGLVVRDGSGLARTNRVPARTLYDVLQAMRDEPLFVEAMAQGGTGTLRRRYKSLGARIRGKTGTIRGVRTLSGYVTGQRGGRYVFVVLANGASTGRARRFQDLLVQALARRP